MGSSALPADGADLRPGKPGSGRVPFWAPEQPLPTRESLRYPPGTRDCLVHWTADSDDYLFLHDPAIAEHGGRLYAAWYNCPRFEVEEAAVVRAKWSEDQGETWSTAAMLACDDDNKIMYVPPALFSWGGRLYAFVTTQAGRDRVCDCEVFVLDEESDEWKSHGSVGGRFLVNTPPSKMADGNFIMAGRTSDKPGERSQIPAVAISQGDKLAETWRLVRLLPDKALPDGEAIHCPETTVIVDGRDITALVRGQYDLGRGEYGVKTSLLFFSDDYGQTWSGPYENDLPMAPSKIYAGRLSTGQRYVIYNLPCEPRRRELAIAVTRRGEKQFASAWKISDEEPKIFGHRRAEPEYSYPYAVEHDGDLHVVYSAGKRHCLMTVVPVGSLAVT